MSREQELNCLLLQPETQNFFEYLWWQSFMERLLCDRNHTALDSTIHIEENVNSAPWSILKEAPEVIRRGSSQAKPAGISGQ